MTIPPLARLIADTVRAAGGRALLVGGCVRDGLLGLEPKDIDIEVFGIAQADMEAVLASCGQVSHVGRAFPVWKVWTQVMGQGLAIDVTLPRKETKRGEGHTDFEITLDPHMSFADASARRDFTINAIGFDPRPARWPTGHPLARAASRFVPLRRGPSPRPARRSVLRAV